MAITQLTIHGSQKSRTFSAKSPGATGRPGDKLTSNSLFGSMRAYATFVAKSPAGGAGGGTGVFWVFGDAVIE